MSVAIAAGILGSAEALWRSLGHRPSLVDSLDLWSYHRARVSRGGKDEVALLGASRIQLGFATDVFYERFPSHQLSQLAVDGRHPIAVLRMLANERAFNGTVLCAITAPGFSRDAWDDQQEYVDYYQRSYSPVRSIEAVSVAYCQSRLAILSPQVRLDRVTHAALAGDPIPEPLYLVTRFDRSRLADYTLLDINAHRERRIAQIKSVSAGENCNKGEWMEDVRIVNQFVKQIQGRGGKVVFIRFPTTEESWQHSELVYPKMHFWDQMASSTTAETIHFKDVPALSGFQCPDTSHLDYRDAPEFTHALLDELVSRGVLTE